MFHLTTRPGRNTTYRWERDEDGFLRVWDSEGKHLSVEDGSIGQAVNVIKQRWAVLMFLSTPQWQRRGLAKTTSIFDLFQRWMVDRDRANDNSKITDRVFDKDRR